jgi:Low psii accumulation1 / Rep27
MVNSPKSKPKKGRSLDPEIYARLKAESIAPYRGLRRFIYFAFGASGFIGALIFLAQLAAGREVYSALPNLALQIGVVALMIWLFRWEGKAEERKR